MVEEESKPSGPGWRLRAFTAFVQIAALLGALGVAVQLTIRDLWPPLAPVAVWLPAPLAALLALPALVLYAKRKQRVALLIATLVVAGGGFDAWRSVYRPPRGAEAAPADGPAPTRLVAWNLADAFWGVDIAAEGVEALEPDVAVLFEAPEPDESRESFGTRFPRCSVVPVGEDGMLIARGSVDDVRAHKLPLGTFTAFSLDLDRGSYHVGVVQLAAASWDDLEPSLAVVEKAVQKWGLDEKIVLVGSFHRPRRSRVITPALERLGLRESFLAAGSGWGAGWPSGLPVYDGEQFWVSADLQIAASFGEFSLRSDHLPWILEVHAKETGR